MKKNALWITRTAVLLALLIVTQAGTAFLGNTLITGSLVNLILIVTVMCAGLASGVTVAALSPFFAKLIGIGPLWSLIPLIALGNVALVLLWHFIGKQNFAKSPIPHAVACITGAVAKFSLLYILVVKVAIPLWMALPPEKAAAISKLFSFPQLFTALIGGAIAMIVVPLVNKAIASRN